MNWGAPVGDLFPYLDEYDQGLMQKWTAMLVEGFCAECSGPLEPVEEKLEGDVVRAMCRQCSRIWWMRNDAATGAELAWQIIEPSGFRGGSFTIRAGNGRETQ